MQLAAAAISCVLSVMTPQGGVCVHPDGTVSYPKNANMDALSKQFWDQIAQGYLNQLFCDNTKTAMLRFSSDPLSADRSRVNLQIYPAPH